MTSPRLVEIPYRARVRLSGPAASQTVGRSILRLARMVLAESRPPVQIIFLLRLVAFTASTGGLGRLAGTGMLGVIGWSMIWIAVYVVNGVSDVEADRRNGSDRPIASGRLPVAAATQACVLLAVSGLLLCALCCGQLVLLGLVGLAIGLSYSAGPVPLKTTAAGTTLAAGSGVLLCYAAGAAIADGIAATAIAAFGLAEAAWIGLCAATKDFSDVEGDRLAGRRTWPTVLGDRGARLLVAVASGSLAAVFAGLALVGGGPSVAAGTAAVGGVALAAVVLRPPATGARSDRRRPYRTLMVTQYAVNIALLASAVF